MGGGGEKKTLLKCKKEERRGRRRRRRREKSLSKVGPTIIKLCVKMSVNIVDYTLQNMTDRPYKRSTQISF